MRTEIIITIAINPIPTHFSNAIRFQLKATILIKAKTTKKIDEIIRPDKLNPKKKNPLIQNINHSISVTTDIILKINGQRKPKAKSVPVESAIHNVNRNKN